MKKTSTPHPQRLDVAGFARKQGRLEGSLALSDLPRLRADTQAPSDAPPERVSWQAEGYERKVLGGAPEVRIRLRAQTSVWLTCQRCLQPLALDLQVDRVFRFARDEEQAAQWDEASEDEDVLAMNRALDLVALVEDELIMGLPLVPRHDGCTQPLLASASGHLMDAPQEGARQQRAAEGQSPSANPGGAFAALASLKLRRNP